MAHSGAPLCGVPGSTNGPLASSAGANKASHLRQFHSNVKPASQVAAPFAKGHQRRQSVARLLPDISKLRLLSWLVEASNELINCDIAIMDGVYAKLNRSRESLLFWQQQQQQQQQQQLQQQHLGPSSNSAALRALSQRPPPPPPPSVGPVANKIVISHQQQHHKVQKVAAASKQKLSRNKSNSLAANETGAGPTSSANNQKDHHQQQQQSQKQQQHSRNHHSLPLTNYDASSLAAISLRSESKRKQQQQQQQQSQLNGVADADSLAAESVASASILLMQQSLQQRKLCDRQRSEGCDLHHSSRRQRQHSESEADEEEEEEEDEDDNSSAAGSTASSGIHAPSMSSSASTSDSCSASSAASSVGSADSMELAASCQLNATQRHQLHLQQQQLHQRDLGQLSSAEQLSERIRRAVLEHNYLQGLLVNVIRQHDRQREELARERRAQLATCARGPGSPSLPLPLGPRIDLAQIAEALEDGCQCACHAMRRRRLAHQESRDSSDERSLGSARSSLPAGADASAASSTPAGKRASTLPSSSALSLFQAQSLVPGVVARKNRRKKHGAAELTREQLLEKLADKLCESCFETHYWLSSCSAIELQAPSTSPSPKQNHHHHHHHHNNNNNNNNSSSSSSSSSNNHKACLDQRQQAEPAAKSSCEPGGVNLSSLPPAPSELHERPLNNKTAGQQQEQLNAIVSLRNATFIKLVQQQVRQVISNSIELIDLIRKEIKSPESIKQKQLMRGFSASIQLLSSVANYVVPAQDISTFIPTEHLAVGQLADRRPAAHLAGPQRSHQSSSAPSGALFSLPADDFDHLLPFSSPFASPAGSYGQSQQSNYHLAPAAEIPLRRRCQPAGSQDAASSSSAARRRAQQRRPSDESSVANSLLSVPLDETLSLQDPEANNFRSLPAAGLSPSRGSPESAAKSHLSESASLMKLSSSMNPNVMESSSGASSNNSSASSSIARNQLVLQPSSRSLSSAQSAPGQSRQMGQNHELQHLQQQQQQSRHDLSLQALLSSSSSSQHPNHHDDQDDLLAGLHGSSRAKFWQSSKFNFIKKLLQVKQQRLLRQQSKDRRIYNNKVQNKFRLVMMDLTHFNKSQQLLATENGVNSLLTSMRNVLEFGLYLTVKLY